MDERLLEQLWTELDGPSSALAAVSFSGPARGLPSVYEVSELASATVGLATLAVAELHALRTGQGLRAVHVDRAHADAAFLCERHLRALGWQLPEVWDPLAGDYLTRDGFIRLHTNYSYHRDAVLRVLSLAAASVTREQLAALVASWDGEPLEAAVVAAGGCAAKLRSPAEWRAHPQGQALASAPLFELTVSPAPGAPRAGLLEAPRAGALSSSDRDRARDPRQVGAAVGAEWSTELSARSTLEMPLAGVRVLDLTRVIAGPIGTRFLAAYGADVLRVDPPGFEEVGALLCEVTAGKRRCALQLREPADRERFLELVRAADVIVHGYRGDALERLGLSNDVLRQHNPNAVIVCHNAYGWTGPWAARRGFDSLVQMSCGIAWRGREVTGKERPVPLPAQALDHGTGYLIAAAAARGLTRRAQTGQASVTRLSLARTAQLLMELGDLGAIAGTAQQPSAAVLEEADTALGRVQRVRCPGGVEGIEPEWAIPAGPLGSDPPRFQI